ncbi:LysR substrate-binding domain-containing protein [Silicimonas sp. MF1-12-2]|uniref:LysR substrate-binding domain-containing protein n=1 Tax=Silicimonas sp. MF1-12-2 TaxID=3384793 RepID=UPI0039B3B684
MKPNFVRGTLEQAAFDQGFKLNIIAEQSSGRLLQSLLADGLGYSVLTWPSFHANMQTDGFFVKRVVKPEFRRPLTIAWQKQSPQTERFLSVRKVLREVVQEAHAEGILRGRIQNAGD